MPVRRGHVAPRTTLIETIIRKFDTDSMLHQVTFFPNNRKMGDILQLPPKITHHNIRETQEKKSQERRRNILLLIHSYLKENYLENTAETLEKEAHALSSYEVCDNVDLDTILQEYNSYYFSKFGRWPKISKKVTPQHDCVEKKKKPLIRAKSKTGERPKPEDEFEITIKQLGSKQLEEDILEISSDIPWTLSMIKLDDYPPEWKEMFQIIIREIIPNNLGFKWSDCIGMEETISLLQESIMYPLEYPQFFGIVSPWKGILLYGPPGTGKTLLAKALACESKQTLINVSPSTFISKWRGESEKLVKCLFEVAKKCSPCTVFIDEIDALASRRDEQQHEASRRFKSELLTQMDGILNNNQKIFILATTNLPWEIDSAILRRFDKKIFIDLPSKSSRAAMFSQFIGIERHNASITSEDLEKFADKTENFSGNDIKLICKNAAMAVVRRSIQRAKREGNKYFDDKRCLPEVNDLDGAISNARSSSAGFREKYVQWQKNFGGI